MNKICKNRNFPKKKKIANTANTAKSVKIEYSYAYDPVYDVFYEYKYEYTYKYDYKYNYRYKYKYN